MKIPKHIFPHWYEYHYLNEQNNNDACEYWIKNIDKIRFEKSYWKETINIRYGLGGDRNIHCPETEYNPPTPFL